MGREPPAAALVLSGTGAGGALSRMPALLLPRRIGFGDVTPRGFRYTSRDYTAEATTFPGDLAEAALARVSRDVTEAAHQRGDLLAKRSRLMEAWAAHCAKHKQASAREKAARGAREGRA